MKIQPISFNIYLLLVSLFLVGCETTEAEKNKGTTKPTPTAKAEKKPERKPKKEFATIRFHLEANVDGTPKTRSVPIYRANPIYVGVEEMVILDEGGIDHAAVIDWAGSYAIQLTFNHQGTFYLDTITTANKGRRLAIYSEFGQSKETLENRWLAAPIIERRNDSGVMIFSPDASREECERIVNGLNNIAKLIKKGRRDPS